MSQIEPSARQARTRGKRRKKKQEKLSRTHKPAGMSLEEWQVALRRQFGREQRFAIVNQGDHPVFSEFAVTNPQSGNTYTVRVRGPRDGDNVCSCPDFATNTLGTCKHIEFTLARLERKRDLRRMLREGYQPPASEVHLQYGSRREVRFRPGSDCPVELARLAAGTFDETGALRPEKAATFEAFLLEASRLEPDLECGDDVLAFLAEVRDAERRKERVAEAFPRGIRSAAFKDLLKVNLYDYQREGALFAARAGRCLIGDEMGLGKTIQALAAAEIMARLYGVERVLIVCPTSLKHQWEREIERFTSRTARVIGGLKPRRNQGFAQEGDFFKITNYDTICRDLEEISAWWPDLVILDEAQRIKNWATRTARSVKKIASPHAIVLTGTPLENRLEELVSIVQFIDLFRLGPTFRLLDTHQIRDEVGKVVGYRELDQLGKTLGPILIRRKKDQVLEQLPGRIDTNVFVPMTDQQRHIHTENAEVVARIVFKWRKYGFLSESDQRRLMTALQFMRMSCDSTYLCDPESDHGHKADEAVTLLDELLEDNVKVVVFSQWVRMHELLIRRLKARKIDHVFFHGGVPGAKRKGLIDRFRDDPGCKVFLSTDAGGVGLNLQFASVVLNMDLPWNPAVLEQRIGRVHRLGQTQPVRVVNFVARGTIEEGMLGVLSFKKSLFKGVLDGGDKEVFLGGSRLKRFMETVEAATGAIPAHAAEEDEEEQAPPEAPAEEQRKPGKRGAAAPAPAAAPAARPGAAPAGAPPVLAFPVSPWAGLIEAGLGILQQLAASSPGNGAGPGTAAAFVQRDERTGESFLRLPVPPPEVLQQAVGAVQKLLESMKR
jgi:superfamily II DNA or RNA helicase